MAVVRRLKAHVLASARELDRNKPRKDIQKTKPLAAGTAPSNISMPSWCSDPLAALSISDASARLYCMLIPQVAGATFSCFPVPSTILTVRQGEGS